MGSITDPPIALATTRESLHRVAVHILGRRRYEVSGRFGLRSSPGGFATPAFGEGPETLRVAGDVLVREVAGTAEYRAISGSTMRDLAGFASTDIAVEFSAGSDTPEIGDVDTPIRLDRDAANFLADWYAFGSRVLDEVVAALPASAGAATIQLWPEHFDIGTDVGLTAGRRVNLGVSPGDAYSAQPYVYIGPWGPERPRDPGFWNAPFGAAMLWIDLQDARVAVDLAVRFFRTGLGYMSGEEPS